MSRLIAILATLILMPGPARAGEPARSGPRANIVIIRVDDLGYGDPGRADPRFLAPHLDRTAGEGVRLARFLEHAAYATGLVCKRRLIHRSQNERPTRRGFEDEDFGARNIDAASGLRRSTMEPKA